MTRYPDREIITQTTCRACGAAVDVKKSKSAKPFLYYTCRAYDAEIEGPCLHRENWGARRTAHILKQNEGAGDVETV
jgi:hypothetical protein